MTTPRTLTEVMDEVSRRNRDWSSPQDLGVDRATLAAAWLASDDPLAMLLLLAALHPRREEETCIGLVAELSFFKPMRDEARRMSYRRAGMHVDGRCPFHFLHLWQRLRAAFVRIEDTERSRLEPELAAAIRVIVDDPFTLGDAEIPDA